jgi:hypothetical protein
MAMKYVAWVFGLILLCAGGAGAQGVYGVLPNYNWELYGGYTFFRFYEVPKTTVNTNGIQISAAYYFSSEPWLGAEGEIFGTFGPNPCSKFVLGSGGVRLRYRMTRGLVLWAHATVGGAHFLPQTVYGKQAGLGFEGGGGVDLNIRRTRFSYRAEGDFVGTRFFSTYQYSPKVSTGIVFHF